MFSIGGLRDSARSTESLQDYLSGEATGLSRYLNSSYSELVRDKFNVDDIIVEYSEVIGQLDFRKYYNALFVLTFLDYSERVFLSGSFEQLLRIAQDHNLEIGKRQLAAKTFLLGINRRMDHVHVFESINSLLQDAYETEEDNEIQVVSTFARYILNAVRSTAEIDLGIARELMEKTRLARVPGSYLHSSLVDQIITIDPGIPDYPNIVKRLVDNHVFAPDLILSDSDNYVIESNTDYESELRRVETSFTAIRNISICTYRQYSEGEQNRIRGELLRGVKIINSEEQLFAYMTLYGRKHQEKLRAAFGLLSNLPEAYNLIDWGCGQGLGSMVFMDNYGSNQIKHVILNEPSELALKRASLHIKKYRRLGKTSTINKSIENLSASDLRTGNSLPNIHLFSNILDIELDIGRLIALLETQMTVKQYFICVSPYINDYKTSKIDMFCDQLLEMHPEHYEMIHSQDIKQADPTLVLRMFSITTGSLVSC